MGDPGKARKQFETPPHPWQSDRIINETQLTQEYGLKNRREIWRAESSIRNFRRQARDVIGKSDEKTEARKKELITRLVRIGVLEKGAVVDDILALDVRDLLDRRLQTLVHKKGIATSNKGARQMILHGHISLNGKKTSTPSILIYKDDEDAIAYTGPPITVLKPGRPKREKKEENAPEEVKEEKREEKKEEKKEEVKDKAKTEKKKEDKKE